MNSISMGVGVIAITMQDVFVVFSDKKIVSAAAKKVVGFVISDR